MPSGLMKPTRSSKTAPMPACAALAVDVPRAATLFWTALAASRTRRGRTRSKKHGENQEARLFVHVLSVSVRSGCPCLHPRADDYKK